MSDLGNVGQSSGQVFTRPDEGNTGAQVSTTGKTLADFQSVVTSLGYTTEQISVYLNSPGRPFLVTPQDSGTTVFDSSKILENIAMKPPPKDSFFSKTTFEKEFQTKLETMVNDPSFLSEIGAKTPEIAETKIKLAFLNPESISDPEIQKAISSLIAGAPQGWPAKEDLDGFKQEIGVRQDNSFEDNLAKMADPKDQTALKNAFYNNKPEDLSESQKAMFKQIMAASNSELQTEFGIPPNIRVPSPNAEYFNTRLNLDLEDEFTKKLVALKLKGDMGLPGGITEKEFNTLKSMLYFKDPSNPAQSSLNSQFEEIYKQTVSQFKTENGLPENWDPEVQMPAGQAMADGAWRDAFAANLNKSDIPQELKNQIMQGLANPAGASPIVQAMIATLVSQTTAEIIESMGLPSSWKPVATKADPNVPAASLLMAKATISNLKNIYEVGLQALKQMSPNDPQRTVLMDYLKKIGDALSKLQETMYIIESASAKTSKTIGLAMQDMQKNKIDEEAKQAEEARKQKSTKGYHKAHDPGKKTFMKIFGPLIALILAMLACLTGNPGLMAVAIFMFSNAVSKAAGGPDLIKGAFELIGKAVAGICKALGLPKSLTNALKMIAKIVVMIAVCVACIVIPGGGMMLQMMILSMFIMESMASSGLITDGIKITNPNPTPAEIQKVSMIVMITLMVTMIVVMLPAMIAMMFASGGTAAAPIAGEFAALGSTMSALGETLSTSLEFLTTLAANNRMLFEVLQVVTKSITMTLNILKTCAQAVRFLGEIVSTMAEVTLALFRNLAKALTEAVKLLIQLLKNAIASLMQKLTPEAMKEAVQVLADGVVNLTKTISDRGDAFLNMIKNSAIGQALENAFAPSSSSSSSSTSSISSGSSTATEAVGTAPGTTIEAGAGTSEATIQAAGASSKGSSFQRVAGYAIGAGDVMQGTSSMVTGITQAQYSMLMAELVRIQARSSAFIEEVDVMIKLLKKIIESLLDGMSPIADFIQDITSLQAKKYQDSSSGAGWNAIAS